MLDHLVRERRSFFHLKSSVYKDSTCKLNSGLKNKTQKMPGHVEPMWNMTNDWNHG